MKKVVVLALVISVLYLLYNKGKAITSLTYKVIGAELKSVGWNDWKLILRLIVNNASKTNIFLQSIDGSIMIDGKYTGNIIQTWNTNITPGDNHLRLEINFNIFEALRQAWQFKSGTKIVSFNGVMKFDNLSLPVKYDYAYGR